jgi:signal transduction histidine kinase
VHPDDIEQLLKDSNDTIAGVRSLDTDFRIFRASDHSLRHIRTRALSVKDKKTGKILKMIGCNWDITAQILAKEEKEKILTDLTRRNNDLEQFAYIISHNLRAPVSNVMSLSDMLINDDFDDESKPTILKGLDRSVKKIDDIINDLNEILQSRQSINDKKEAISIPQLARDIKLSINNIVIKDNVTFHYDFGEVDYVFTVRSYLYSILYNLILNSIKYRRDEVALVITITAKLQENQIIKIWVADNGKGIDLKRNKDTLFGLYQRFDQTVEGRGLGLYMVKTQVEALGGTIQVESQPGKGTTFEITMPA